MPNVENPFVYGRYVTGEAFTDREEELAYLVRELQSNGRIFLISPRRYGKSSLLQRARQELMKQGLLVAYFDLYKIATMNQFAEAYTTAILEASKSKRLKILKWLTDFLPRLRPKISFEAPEAPSVSLDYSLESEESWKELEAVYHLPQKIALREKKKFVVMFDEFQEIEKLGGEALEKQLRAAIQSHHRVNYVFAGSKRHVLYDMISNRARAFYQLGEVLNLRKIPPEEMARFIRENMAATGFKIDEGAVQLILDEMRNVPNNVQLLCHRLWSENQNTKRIAIAGVQQAMRNLIFAYAPVFAEIWDTLTLYQQKLLKAIAHSGGAGLASVRHIRRYELRSSSAVARGLKLLQQKGIVEKENAHYIFTDIFFEKWVMMGQ
jgi:AAA+ ATPase superfamily predicted ATPase